MLAISIGFFSSLLVRVFTQPGPSRDIVGIPRFLNVIHLGQRVLGRPIGDAHGQNGSNYFPPLRCLEATNVAKESLTGQPQKVKTKFRILEIELLEIPVADRK
jgi:hypothetical protein